MHAKDLTKTMIDEGKMYSWQPSSISNSFEFFYGAFYDGSNALRLFPIELRHFREEQYKESIRNPRVFLDFFGLDYEAPHCSHFELCSNSLLRAPSPLKCDQTLNCENELFGGNNDLEFSIYKTFIKVNKFIAYKQSEKDFKDLLKSYKVEVPNEKVLVDRFFHVIGFKLLFSNSLKNLVTDLIQSLSPVIEKFTKKEQREPESATPTPPPVPEPNQPVKLSHRTSIAGNLSANDRAPPGACTSEFPLDPAPKSRSIKEFLFAIVINKPQINMFDDYTETQVLFGSDGNSVLLVSNDFLEYDAFQQDPKRLIDFYFHNLNLYTGEIISAFPTRLIEAVHLGGRRRRQNPWFEQQLSARLESSQKRQSERHSELRLLRFSLAWLQEPPFQPEV